MDALGDVAVQVHEVTQDTVGEKGSHEETYEVDVSQLAFFEEIGDD